MEATSLEVRLENILRERDSGKRKIVEVIIEEIKTTHIRAYLNNVLSITDSSRLKGVPGRG